MNDISINNIYYTYTNNPYIHIYTYIWRERESAKLNIYNVTHGLFLPKEESLNVTKPICHKLAGDFLGPEPGLLFLNKVRDTHPYLFA